MKKQEEKNSYDKVCACCKAKIGSDYDFSNYVYKHNEYSPKVKDYVVRFFCSWNCYRKYLKEKNHG